jgi:hypothetical protein
MTADDQLLLLFEQIALERLSIPTLQRRGRDFLDFHDISVWGLLTVLEDAYNAGLKAGRRAP